MLTFPVGEDMAVFVKPLVISIQSLLSPLDAQHAREGMGGEKKDGGDWDLFPGEEGAWAMSTSSLFPRTPGVLLPPGLFPPRPQQPEDFQVPRPRPESS